MRKHLFFVLVAALGTGCLEAQNLQEMPEEVDPIADPETSPRVLDNLQVLYTFNEGKGFTVKDVSGVEPAYNLELDNLVANKWIPEGGIDIVGPSTITSLMVAEKVFSACVTSNAVTLEAWIEPATTTQTGTIFAWSKNGQANVRMVVDQSRYAGAARVAYIGDDDNDPATPDDTITTQEGVQSPDNTVGPGLQHVVFARDAEGASLYVNGVDVRPPQPTQPDPNAEPEPIHDFTTWSPAYNLALGNEGTAGSPWLGKLYLAAVYCGRLSLADAQKNFAAGH